MDTPRNLISNKKIPKLLINDKEVLNSNPNLAPEISLASPEIDDLNGDEIPNNHPYPGVDDSFFSNGKTDPDDTQIEIFPLNPSRPWDDSDHPDPDDPSTKTLNGETPGDGGPSTPTEDTPFLSGGNPLGEGDDTEIDIDEGDGILTVRSGFVPDDSPDLNVYQHKKTLAQGMMDLALLSANANQLRYVLESHGVHPYYYPSLVMISISLILQVAVGVGLIWNAKYNVKDEEDIQMANKVNNFTVSGIFLVTVVNVFISAFGVAVSEVHPQQKLGNITTQ